MTSQLGRAGTAAFIIAYIATCDGPTLTVDQIRQWKRRGHVRRIGTDPNGYAVYDLDDVIRYVRDRGMFAKP